MKFHPIANIFPMMSESEFEELKEDISRNGLIEPIWTYQDKIIDGRNRYTACTEIGVKPRFRKWSTNNGRSVIDFIISLNLKRRHLNASQKAMSAVDALPYYEREAKKRKLSTLKKGNKVPVRAKIPNQEKGRARDIVSKLFNVSGRYIQTAKTINEKLPEVADQIRKGNLTITQGKAQLKRQERVDALKKAGKQFKSNHHLKIVHADFYKWCNKNLDDNSIDMILTDPPYGKEYLSLYTKLGEVAERVLKPSGWLVAYCSVKFIPEITKTFSEHLAYWWMMCLSYKGMVKMRYSMYNSWRPVLIYYKKPPRLPKLFNDHFACNKREKDFHEWQQAEAPIQYIIEKFSNVGDQILDPMSGAGTVLKASRELKRKCIAIDKSKECVDIMRGRMKLK